MNAPSGLGMWIAYKPPTPIPMLAEIGAEWVAPRGGLNGWQRSSLAAIDLAAYKKSGRRVYAWIYVTKGGWKASLNGFVELWDTGLCDGLIVDAEAEWCGPDAADNDHEANTFVDSLLYHCEGAWIAHSPMDYIENHPTFPWAAFGRLDAVLPQIYAYEHDDQGHVHHLLAVDEQWRTWEAAHPQLLARPRLPIGCTYRPKFRGSDANKKPIPLPAWPDQGARVAADVAAFLDHPLIKACPAPSLYTLEAAHPEVIAMLAARVRTIETPTTQPETAPNDPYEVDRQEAEISDTDPAPKDPTT